MPAWAPPSDMFVAVTVLPLPTLAVAKVFGPAAEQVTTSAPITPVREQRVIVAAVVPSYTLLPAVTLGVTVAAVMLAVVVAEVEESV